MKVNGLKIGSNTKIYVVCPANVSTGGPELLHQLVYQLKQFGFSAFMYYYGNDRELNSPVHKDFTHYNNAYVENIEDSNDNILIVPEVNTSILYCYKKIRKVIWWLSVDNYYKQFASGNIIKIILKKMLYIFGIKKIYRFNRKENIIHLVQSYYAKDYLLKKGISNIYYLSDYLNEIFIETQLKRKDVKKLDLVVYNPKKGIDFTKMLINYDKNIEYVPIQNMSRVEVADLLSFAKVYIDFGNHPGKDRIPREAAISGCCVITGKRGSASFYEDLPIKDEYKFDDDLASIPYIVEKIKDCFINYQVNSMEFDDYRRIVTNDKKKFKEDARLIFLSE